MWHWGLSVELSPASVLTSTAPSRKWAMWCIIFEEKKKLMLNYFYFYFEPKGPTQGKDSSRSICGGTRISSFKSAENSGSGVLFLDFDFVIFALKPWTTGWGLLQDRRPTQEWKHGSKSRMNQTFTWWWPDAGGGCCHLPGILFDDLMVSWCIFDFWSAVPLSRFIWCDSFVFVFCLSVCLLDPPRGNPCPSAHHHTVHQLCSQQRRK